MAIDFFTTEIYTLSGLTRYMVLVSIHYATRKVEVVGIIQQAYRRWMRRPVLGIHLLQELLGLAIASDAEIMPPQELAARL